MRSRSRVAALGDTMTIEDTAYVALPPHTRFAEQPGGLCVVVSSDESPNASTDAMRAAMRDVQQRAQRRHNVNRAAVAGRRHRARCATSPRRTAARSRAHRSRRRTNTRTESRGDPGPGSRTGPGKPAGLPPRATR